MPGSSRKLVIAGWILSALPSLMLLSGAFNAFRHAPFVVQGTIHLGYPEHLLLTIGFLEVLCTILFLLPRTSVVGAILLTGYFGGAVASHVRIGETQWIAPFVFGVLIWIGLVLRENRLRALLPLTSQERP